MNIKCKICNFDKHISLFYKRHTKCIECWNFERKEKRPKSICRHCKIEFRAGKEGRYKFCNDRCRFLNKIKINEETGCWIWIASKNRRGYGTFVPSGKRSGLAHRESYRIFKGDFDNSLSVCHVCDIPLCVNPDHLWIGSHEENMRDMVIKERAKTKLDASQVLEMRNMIENMAMTQADICRKFNISRAQISRIMSRIRWKHI